MPSTGFPFYTYMIGTNDLWIYGTSTTNQAIFQGAHQAEIAWLAIPEGNKTRGQNGAVTYTGTWSNSTYYGGTLGRVSNTSGSTATISTYGTVAYVAVTMQDGNAGTFSLAIDGGAATSYNAFSSGTIATHWGRTYTPYLIRIGTLADGPHTIVLTVTSATSSSNKVWLDWVAGNEGFATQSGPQVYAAGVPRQHATSYTDAQIQSYCTLIRQDVSTLAADGLTIAYVDTTSYINPLTDLYTDGIHPLDSGFAHLYTAFMAAMQGIPTPADRGNARVAAQFTGQPWFQPNYQTQGLTLGSYTGSPFRLTVSAPTYGQMLVIATGANPGGIFVDTTVANQQSFINFNDLGVNKFSLYKNTNNTLGLWDIPHTRNVFATGVNGDLYLLPTGGNVGVGTSAPNTLFNLGAGTPTTAANGIQFGTDALANLYRSAAGVVKTDGAFAGHHQSAGGTAGLSSASCSSWTDGLCTTTGYTTSASYSGTCNTAAASPYTVTSTGGANNFSSLGVGMTILIT